MRQSLNLFLIIFLVSHVVSCNIVNERVKGNGTLVTESRDVNRANKIRVQGSMDVEVTPGPLAVQVEADENLVRYLITEMDDGWLEIKIKRGISISTVNPMKVYITTPAINNVSMAGSGNLVAEGNFANGERVTVKIAGSGDVRMDVNAPNVKANIAGSGNIFMKGLTRDLDVDVAGSGNFHGSDLKSENASVKIAGSGDVNVFADVRLNAKIIGSGNLGYTGNPEVNRKIMGSGSVSKIP